MVADEMALRLKNKTLIKVLIGLRNAGAILLAI